MGEIINLRQARRTKARASKDAQSAENRSKFGRTLAQKQLEKTSNARERKILDDHKLSTQKDNLE